jgi:hypothetical protein
VAPQAWTLLGFGVAGLVLIALGLTALGPEGQRLQKHVARLRAGPPGIDRATAAADLARLAHAFERLGALGARAAMALAQIRGQAAFLNRLVRGFPGPT